jgi:hypothetical protein
VIGEALIGPVPHGGPDSFQARPGGSPFNVAVGLARLGQRTHHPGRRIRERRRAGRLRRHVITVLDTAKDEP